MNPESRAARWLEVMASASPPMKGEMKITTGISTMCRMLSTTMRYECCCYGNSAINVTLIERKSRMPQIQGVTGKAVVNYCKPVTTPKIPA